MKRSAVRELLKLTAQPGMISFAGGLPAPELFPVEAVRRAADAALALRGGSALQYGETEGLAELRDWIAARFSRTDAPLDRSRVAIVSGAQQGLDLLGRVLLDPGDAVVVENPTYLALLSAWRPLGARFLPVPSDARGMRVDELESLLRQRPKLIYVTPTFQNPQGTTLTLERRVRLVELAHRYDVALIEDDPYGELRYEGESLPSLFDLAGRARGHDGSVIHVGTFSKTLAPGLRVGWALAAPEVIDQLTLAKQAADLHTSTLNQGMVLELLREGALAGHLPRLRDAYRQRRDAMLAALEAHLPPSVRWTRPEGGMFLLVTLPLGWSGAELLKQALARNVAFVPGEDFHLDGAGRNTFRLNFSNATPERIEEGVKRLGEALRAWAPERSGQLAVSPG